MTIKARTALITGISGQDGAYLARILVDRGYAVHGTSRSLSKANLTNLSRVRVRDDVKLHEVDYRDATQLEIFVGEHNFSHVFHLAAPSSVASSFLDPIGTIDSIVVCTQNLVRAIERSRYKTRFVNACSSECFGDVSEKANETTKFCPVSPYGIAKGAAHRLVERQRASGRWFSSAILFNHESPFRDPTFVTKKIIRGAIDASDGKIDYLELGNLDVVRDWGWAPEYMEAMALMGEQDQPQTFVVATGVHMKLTRFVELAFEYFGLDWTKFVHISPDLMRSADINVSVGDPKKIDLELGWRAKAKGPTLIELLIEAELGIHSREKPRFSL
ncbi:GDP-mannose 4,6-dehydratase [Bauldia litoralis]|uniref:GDP-mannose 4,6-dehydratase n=1 Tax=Bauldia litoralis TaxID=665467 RepID=A0A1G6CVW5_9HYPH|nr:GDP-mannose 4,6-dehydratase [Bauldia litoralis]SDB37000.1 GDPmannose 4,6-dehydratase [Bauldia litoralis]